MIKSLTLIIDIQNRLTELARKKGIVLLSIDVEGGMITCKFSRPASIKNIGGFSIDLNKFYTIEGVMCVCEDRIDEMLMLSSNKPDGLGRIAYTYPYLPTIKKVHFNDPVTVVLWADNTKTIVRTQNSEPFDPEKGLAMAIAKKALGNKGNYFDTIKKWVEKYESENCTVEFVNDLGERIASAFGKIGEIKIPTITPKFDPNTPVPKIKFDTDVNLIGKVQIPGLDIESYHSQIDEFISGIIKERNDAIDGEFHRRLAEAGLKVEPINGPEFTDLRKEGTE